MNFQEAKSKTLAQFIDMLMNGETDTMSKGDCVIRVLDMLQENLEVRVVFPVSDSASCQECGGVDGMHRLSCSLWSWNQV